MEGMDYFVLLKEDNDFVVFLLFVFPIMEEILK